MEGLRVLEKLKLTVDSMLKIKLVLATIGLQAA